MKFLLPLSAIGAASILGACMSTDAQLMTNPNQAIELMQGQGSASRSPDGKTTFRFVLPKNAYAGILEDPEQLEDQRARMLSQWIAKEKICTDGYAVENRTEVTGTFPTGPMLVYEGRCV